MSKVWIVTEGDYEDNHIVGVFSTKEKANEYYNTHVGDDLEIDAFERYTSYYGPDEYELDKVGVPTRAKISAKKVKGVWQFFVSGVLDNSDGEIGEIYHHSTGYWITVEYNSDRDVMKQQAKDCLFKYLSDKEEF